LQEDIVPRGIREVVYVKRVDLDNIENSIDAVDIVNNKMKVVEVGDIDDDMYRIVVVVVAAVEDDAVNDDDDNVVDNRMMEVGQEVEEIWKEDMKV